MRMTEADVNLRPPFPTLLAISFMQTCIPWAVRLSGHDAHAE
jgi:hypothetical protein